jgi:parallel beta-helix repeat protein
MVMRRPDLLSGVLLASLVLLAFSVHPLFPVLNVAAAPRRIVVPDDFSAIQQAVNSAYSGDVVFVRSGNYSENIVIDKSLTLVGEDISSTVVDGGGSGSVFTVSADYVGISNLTIRNSGVGYPNSGIRVLNSSGCTFKDNILLDDFVGILLDSSYLNHLERNQILRSQYGVYLLTASGNEIMDSTIASCYAAFVVYSTDVCEIVGNKVYNNTVGISMSASSGNLFYHNNFINNQYQTFFFSDAYSNAWDNGYPKGGNYWSNHHGRDIYKGSHQNITGSDGIADNPYVIDANNIDRFPYMDPVTILHDVAVLSVVPSSLKAYQGQALNISVVVANLGNYTESPVLSVYCVNDSDEILIGAKNVTSLATNASAAVIFNWSTSALALGSWVIKAQLGLVEGEKSSANNVLWSDRVSVTERFHDVAVLSVVPSSLRVYQGQALNISVVVANLGNYTESFDVTAYYDDKMIGRQSVANLEVGSDAALVFRWDTAGVEPGKECMISAEANGIDGEVNLDNNVFVDGYVKVRSFELEAVKIGEVIPSDRFGNPLSSFSKGAIGYFKVVVNNTSVDSEVVLVTVNVYDMSSASLGVVSFIGLIMPGISVFVLGLPIPNTVQAGMARVYANTFTDWPFTGGLPYGQERSTVFQIVG